MPMCALCGGTYRIIETVHLRIKHAGMTMQEYFEQFGEGRTWEETFGTRKGMYNGGGPVSGLTPDVHERAVELFRDGNYAITVARALGIEEATLGSWLQRGKEMFTPLNKGEIPAGQVEEERKYVQFYKDVLEAQGEAEASALTNVRIAGGRDYKADLEFLGRRYPKRWGNQSQLRIQAEVSGSTSEALGLDLSLLTDDEIEVFERLISKAQVRKTESATPALSDD